jgi:hypothetical protein
MSNVNVSQNFSIVQDGSFSNVTSSSSKARFTVLIDQPTRPYNPQYLGQGSLWTSSGTPDQLVFTDNQGTDHIVETTTGHQQQNVQAEYTLTSTDIVNGYALVPITWPTAWTGAFSQTFSVVDQNVSINRAYSVGAAVNVTNTGFDAMVLLSAPVIFTQGQLDALDVTAPQSLVVTAPLGTLYMITIYIASHNTGSGTQAVQTYITYTDATGIGPQTFGFPVLGQILGTDGPLNSQNFTFPLYCIVGTPISITTAFVEAGTNTPIGTTFAYDFSARVVQMPNNSIVSQPGNRLLVNASSFAV